MPDLTDFLLARITEDRTYALSSHNHWTNCEAPNGEDCTCIATLGKRNRRRLAECESKRRIVNRWKDLTYEVEQAERLGDYDAAPVATAFAYEQVIEILATVYADHADYAEPWRAE